MSFKAGSHAHIVIIGGGAIGCALAYHLARRGQKDVLLLEKAQLTHGSTWHAAGLVGQLRGKKNLTRLMQNSVAVFDRLEAETGQAIEWKKVGSLRLAGSQARWSEIRRSMQLAKSFGFEAHALSPDEAKAKFPYIDTAGVIGAAYIPSDGYIDPYSLTMAYAAGARKNGARLREGVTVAEIAVENRRAVGVVTDHGSIGCDILVNCAGIWAKRVGEMAGVALAAGVVEHQYFLTEKKLDLPKDLTTLRDPDNNFYLKPDTGAFAIGGWEDGAKECWRGLPPTDFRRELFPPNMDRLELFALPAATRLPILNDLGIQRIVNGPIPVSADGEPIMGLAPELHNFYVACGFTAGIAASGGAGEAMANLILEGDAGMDLWPFDVRRFGAIQAQSKYLQDRAVEAYGAYYKIHWPAEEMESARNVRQSPLYGRLKAARAVFGSKNGWERPNWFAPASCEPVDRPSFEGKPNWFDAVGAECAAIRQRVAIIDQSSFGKFRISGPGALEVLNRIAANELNVPVGRCVYTQLCNERGGVEADVTIIRTGEAMFNLVTGAGFGIRDSSWILRHLPTDGRVTLTEMTTALATLNIVGPRARDVLQAVSSSDISNDALPYMDSRVIEVGHARVFAARAGYVGELGYELYVPVEFAGHVYDALWSAGQAHGIANAGYRAIESCRLEKGYLYWSADLSPDHNPFEAGLGFAIALSKPDFIGRAALEQIKREGVKRRLVSFTIEGFAPCHGGETILLDGEVVGSVSSAGYGHNMGKTIALGYIPTDCAAAARFGIEAFGRRYQANRGPRCLYDPAGLRLKA